MRFLSLQQCWAIEPNAARSYLQIYEAILARRESATPQNAVDPRGDVETIRAYAMSDGVAQINVRGPIVPHADLFSEVSGMASVEGIKAQINAVLADDTVKSWAMIYDTPGGQTTAISDLAHFIAAADKIKPSVGFIEGMCCSAGNWLAAGHSERVISKTGLMGSIGCMVAWTDDRAMKEMVGLQDIEFISSQSPLKNPDPLSDEGKAEYQRLVDENAAVFISDMAALYGVPVATVKNDFGRGGVLTGKSAVKAGLADRVGSIDDVIALMSKGKFKQKPNGATRANGGKSMTVAEFLKAPLSALTGGETLEGQEAPLEPLAATTPQLSASASFAPMRIAGMTEEEVLAMKAKLESQESVVAEAATALAQSQETRAQAFAATHAASYLENGDGEEASDRANFVAAATNLHLKAQRGESVTTAELDALMNVPRASAVMQTGVLTEPELEGATAHVTQSASPEAEAKSVVDGFIAKANAERGHKPKD